MGLRIDPVQFAEANLVGARPPSKSTEFCSFRRSDIQDEITLYAGPSYLLNAIRGKSRNYYFRL